MRAKAVTVLFRNLSHLSSYLPSSFSRGIDKKMRLVECVVAREKDFGVNDIQHTVITNLGNILKEGDMVFG